MLSHVGEQRCCSFPRFLEPCLERTPSECGQRSAHGGRRSADSVQSLLGKHVRVAPKSCPSLKAKSVSPHVLRHSAAMLQTGVDCSVIALWLGHESVETTQTYLHAHLALKEAALAKLKPYERGKRTRFQPNDRLLAFLETL
nr:tyrosine-type recombinase/integrase [Bradyrhizobium elkanii]